MIIDETLYKVRTFWFGKTSNSFMLAFKYFMIMVLIVPNLRAILSNISGVKYHFVVHFPMVSYIKTVEDKHILLNS